VGCCENSITVIILRGSIRGKVIILLHESNYTKITLRLLPGILLLRLLKLKSWKASSGNLKLSLYNHFFPLTQYDNALEHPQVRQCTYV